MQPAQRQSSKMSGKSLGTTSIVLAVLPVILEVISDGGLGQFGKPETGYIMAFTGFVIWPAALICLLIGLKRLLITDTGSPNSSKPLEDIKPITITNAWADIDKSAKPNTPNEKDSV